MEEEEFRRRGQEIQDHLAEQLSKNLDIPVYSIDNNTVEMIYENLLQIGGVEENYSADELRREISEFISHILVARPADQDEFQERIDAFLDSIQVEKTFEGSLIIPSVSGLPPGITIGSLEIVEEGVGDERFHEYLEHVTESTRIRIEGRTHAKVEFHSYTTADAHDLLFEVLELPFAVLALILDFDLNPRDCFAYVRSPQTSKAFFVKPEREFVGWASYHPDRHEELLEPLSSITTKERRTRLQNKILQAIQVYGLSRLSRKSEIRFIFLISSLESLLLTESDRDYLGKKLAEKTSFLLEKEYERRLELYKLMKRYYGKRSDLVHRGNTSIDQQEIRTLQSIFRSLTFRLLELSNDYEKMEQKAHENDPEGVEDYIHRLRFSGNV